LSHVAGLARRSVRETRQFSLALMQLFIGIVRLFYVTTIGRRRFSHARVTTKERE
jgi:hypothetical protein